MRVAIVAGEASGDQLAAGLIGALRAAHPDLIVEAVAGPALREAGCTTILADAEELAVMGIAEVLPELARLLRLRRRLRDHWLANPPDVFIGVDAPDFNLGLAASLRKAGVPTVHYVSPTVWAWRPGRVHRIAKAVNTVLCLFPFEPACYAGLPIRAEYVGHPFAGAMARQPSKAAARQHCEVPADRRAVALVPGSRGGEVRAVAPAMFAAAARLWAADPGLYFVLPAANAGLAGELRQLAAQTQPQLPLKILDGDMRLALRAAELALVTSGTATLETLLAQTPMVVTYRAAPFTAFLLRGVGLLRSQHVSLPNILAGRGIVPELLQAHAEPELLARAGRLLLSNQGAREAQLKAFAPIAADLHRDTNKLAADAVLATCGRV